MTRLYVLPLVVVLLLHLQADAQDACLTPNNKNGICINIRNCSALVDILKRPRPLSQTLHDFLLRSQCGFDGMYPKVCCEQQITVPERVTEVSPTPQTTTFPAPPDVSGHPNIRLLNYTICGPVTQSKIYGGNKTRVFEYPWMALLAYNVGKPTPEYRCGGSIVTTRYILTAAHCVTGLAAGLQLVGVRIGEHNLGTERDCDKDEDGLEIACAERYQDFGLENVLFHPSYSRTKLQNDIALLRLDRDADFKPKNVKPICMPIGPAATMNLRKVTVTGWGTTELGPRSQDLLKVELAPVPFEQCQTAYKGNAEIWYKQMCAGGKKGMDSCFGDSGGPLQAPGVLGHNFRFFQYGVVSFGLRNCGLEGYPGVYTKVLYYMDWILDNISN